VTTRFVWLALSLHFGSSRRLTLLVQGALLAASGDAFAFLFVGLRRKRSCNVEEIVLADGGFERVVGVDAANSEIYQDESALKRSRALNGGLTASKRPVFCPA
jgi:hypothetical protein